MTYFCFIESSILSVPHMEPLAARTDAEAIAEAEALLDQHASGYAAHILHGQDPVHTILRTSAVAGPLPATAADAVGADPAAPSPMRSDFP